jgi:ATP-binding cassette subfamily B protein
MESSNHVNSVIVEYVEGIEVIKAFNQSASSYRKFVRAVHSFKEFALGWYKSAWPVMNFTLSVLPSSLLGTVPIGILLYTHDALSVPEFAICIILSLGIIAPFLKFTQFVNDMKAIEYAVKAADKFLNMEELKSAEKEVHLPNHDIRFHSVSFSYDGEEGEKALSDLDLEIKEGDFTALVGPSGGGKSTIARMIARFWDVSSGSITIGGINIKEIPLPQLMKVTSYVTQDNFLFDCSLKENIRMGNPAASDEEVYKAARAAGCDNFILKLDNGYDTTAGEAGRKLSGGEKQRITIARAMVKNAPIVILDEATAFTDPENEEKIQKSISALTEGKTLLVIAHRLSTVKNADRIILINRGKVIQSGTHEVLLEESDLYSSMWQAHIHAKSWSAGNPKEVNTHV